VSNPKGPIQVFEHHWLRVDDAIGFTESHFDALVKYGDQTKEKYFTVGHQRVKFGQNVGVIQVKNFTIEILPKADRSAGDEASKAKWRDALLTILQECKLIKI